MPGPRSAPQKDAAFGAFARLASWSLKLIPYKAIRHSGPRSHQQGAGLSIRVRRSALVASNAGLRKIHLDHHRHTVRGRISPRADIGPARQSAGDEHHRRRFGQRRRHTRHFLVSDNAESRAGGDSAQQPEHLPRRKTAIDGPGIRAARRRCPSPPGVPASRNHGYRR